MAYARLQVPKWKATLARTSSPFDSRCLFYVFNHPGRGVKSLHRGPGRAGIASDDRPDIKERAPGLKAGKWAVAKSIGSLGGLKRKLKTSPYDAAIFGLAVPAMLALATDPLLSMVDTAFIGRLGPDELAALGVNTSVFSLAFLVFNFLAVATTPTLAAALSKRDKKKAGQVTYQAGVLAILLGLAVVGAFTLQGDSALGVMGLDSSQAHVHDLALEYLRIRALAAPAVLFITVGQGVFRGMQNMRTPLVLTLGTNLVHLVLDPLLMFQLGLGLPGAAISTTVSEWMAAVAYCALVWKERSGLGLWPPPRMSLADAKDYLPFFKAGSAVLLRTGVLLGTKTLATAVATRLGPVPVASHQVLIQLWMLASMVVDSLAVAGQTLVAVALGKDHKKEARDVSNRLLQLGLSTGVLLAVLLCLLSPVWAHLFTNEPSVVMEIESLLPLAVGLLPVNALVYVLDGILVGASDFQYLTGAMAVASVGAASMLALVEPLGWGLEGVWGSMALLMVGRLITLAWRYQSGEGPVPPTGPRCLDTFEHPHEQVAENSSSSTAQEARHGALLRLDAKVESSICTPLEAGGHALHRDPMRECDGKREGSQVSENNYQPVEEELRGVHVSNGESTMKSVDEVSVRGPSVDDPHMLDVSCHHLSVQTGHKCLGGEMVVHTGVVTLRPAGSRVDGGYQTQDTL